jgi:Flp pilus assembly protein TadG
MGRPHGIRDPCPRIRVDCRFAERGQSLLEMAFLTPVLLLLMVGIIEVGRFAYYSIEVTNAARAGVQYGAQNLADANDITGIQQAALRDAADVSGLTFNPRPKVLCACSESSSVYVGCPATGCTGHPIVFVQVDTTANFSPLFHYPGLPTTFTADGHAIMRVAQ